MAHAETDKQQDIMITYSLGGLREYVRKLRKEIARSDGSDDKDRNDVLAKLDAELEKNREASRELEDRISRMGIRRDIKDFLGDG